MIERPEIAFNCIHDFLCPACTAGSCSTSRQHKPTGLSNATASHKEATHMMRGRMSMYRRGCTDKSVEQVGHTSMRFSCPAQYPGPLFCAALFNCSLASARTIWLAAFIYRKPVLYCFSTRIRNACNSCAWCSHHWYVSWHFNCKFTCWHTGMHGLAISQAQAHKSNGPHLRITHGALNSCSLCNPICMAHTWLPLCHANLVSQC